MTLKEKIEHINKCEFHRGTKVGECPLISNKEAIELIKQYSIQGNER